MAAQIITIKWKGAEFQKLTEDQVRKGLALAGINIVSDIKQSISTRGGKGKHSDPGEPPFVQSNRLRASIASEQEGDVVRIGTNMEYGRRQELGFTGKDSLGRKYNQKPRPYLRPALDRAAPIVEDAMKKAAKL